VKKFLSFLISFFIFGISFSFVEANDPDSFYKTTYLFDQSGLAYITQEVSLVNQTADYYVSEYTLSVVGSKISEIKAYDKVGPLQVKTQEKEKTTIISLKFNEKVVGEGRVLSFILKYQAEGLAKKEGNLWQIAVPRLANQDYINEYQLQLKIPQSFGKIAFVNPNPRQQQQKEGYLLLDFEKKDLLNFGAVITLGQYQTFNFLIQYQLKNPTSSAVYEKIAIPPETDSQSIYYQSLEPKPVNVEVDEDGNWLALYKLGPQESFAVETQGQVKIFSQSKSQTETGFDFPGKEYLSPQKYWPSNNEKIVTKAQELKTPEKIYRFVVNTLDYDYNEVKKESARKGALAALENPQKAVCSEFVDLFVALLRAAGIPSRELVGFAFTENEKLKEISQSNDMLHSWAQYFDQEKKNWIAVDPTWEKTSGGLDYFHKFDLAHFTFVIHGLSDTYPPSPGAYRQEGSEGKQVFVSLAKEEVLEKKPYFSIKSISPKTIYSAKNNRIEVVLKNESGFSLKQPALNLSGNLTAYPSEHSLETLPPYSLTTFSFNLKPPELMKDYEEQLIFTLDGAEVKVKIKVYSLVLRVALIGGGFFALVLALLLLKLKKKSCLSTKDDDKLNKEAF